MIKFCIAPLLFAFLVLASSISTAEIYEDKLNLSSEELDDRKAYINFTQVKQQNCENLAPDQKILRIENSSLGNGIMVYCISGVNTVNIVIFSSFGTFATSQINPLTNKAEYVLGSGALKNSCTSPQFTVFQNIKNNQLYINTSAEGWRKGCYSKEQACYEFKPTEETFNQSDLGTNLLYSDANVYVSKSDAEFEFVPFRTMKFNGKEKVFQNGSPFYREEISFPIPENTTNIKVVIPNPIDVYNPEITEKRKKNITLVAGIKFTGDQLEFHDYGTPESLESNKIEIKKKSPKSKKPLNLKKPKKAKSESQKTKSVKKPHEKETPSKPQSSDHYTTQQAENFNEIKQEPNSDFIVTTTTIPSETAPAHQAFQSEESSVKQATNKKDKKKQKTSKKSTPNLTVTKIKEHKPRKQKPKKIVNSSTTRQEETKTVFLKNSTSYLRSKSLPPSKKMLGVVYAIIASGSIALSFCGNKISFLKKIQTIIKKT
ncbi:MAG: hypothetical protein LBJ83_03415 [Oscillospiraceae bacterium]|jgi:hypothetical protein|nr:hypothetical protein [Oscillospiraceae bacterium]